MKIENVFVNVLASDKLEVDNKVIENFCLKTPEISPGKQYSNEGGYQSHPFDMNKVAELSELKTELQKRVDSFYDFMGFNPSLKKTLDYCWVNINPTGTYNSMHIHTGCIFVGVYYVKVPENSGTVQLMNPIPAHYYVMDQDLIAKQNEFTSSSLILQPKEKELYIFPSWLYHDVKLNLSMEPRISIAFNIGLEK